MGIHILGVDVARKSCQWAVLNVETRTVVATGEVHPQADALSSWVAELLAAYGIEGAAVEATGGWEEAVVKALRSAEVPVLIANPKRVHRLREALGWAKTDALDAHLIALYALLRGETTPAPSEHQEAVEMLLKRREHLVDMRQRERQRLQRTRHAGVRSSLERSLDFLDEELARIDQELEAAVKQWEEADPGVARSRALLQSVPGVGPQTSIALLVWLPELGTLTPKQAAALTGTAPMANDSGQKSGRRRVREGRKRLRRYLFLSAMSASRFAPPLRAFYQRLREAGKPGHVALVAVARRLVVILNAIIRTGQPWNPELAMPRTP